MRLLLVPCICGMAALLAAPVTAQPALPARTFDLSLPAVAPTPAPPTVEWWRNGGPRLRETDVRISVAVRNGLQRSSLLRGLADRIEASNVVVYMGIDPRMPNGLAGRLTFVAQAGRYRYLRAMLNPELSGDKLISAIAHELQHVIEVIDHPEVDSEAALSTLYRRIGHSNRAGGVLGWESSAAQDMGAEVRRELNIGEAAALARREAARREVRE
jgi:hypothetical protein